MTYKVSDLNQKIIKFLVHHPPKTVKDIAKAFNLTESNAHRHLQTLMKQKQAQKFPHKNGKEEYYYNFNNDYVNIIERFLGITDRLQTVLWPEEKKFFERIKNMPFFEIDSIPEEFSNPIN